MGHGGFFKTKGVGQRIMAAAADVPVSVMETAGEGGAWGIAVLAAYRKDKKPGQSLSDYLNEQVFADAKAETMEPDAKGCRGLQCVYDKLYQWSGCRERRRRRKVLIDAGRIKKKYTKLICCFRNTVWLPLPGAMFPGLTARGAVCHQTVWRGL